MQRRARTKLRTKYTTLAPAIMLAALPLAGCTRVTSAPPGGTYISESAGGSFEQSVDVANTEGEYIAQFPLQKIDRPPHAPDTIYIAAGNRGIVVSEDNGKDWNIIETPLAFATDVVALENGTLVAAGTDGVGQGFVVRSLDQGKSWNSVFTVPVPKDTSGGLSIVGGGDVEASIVLSIERDPFNPDRIYGGSSLGTLFIGEQSAKVWRTMYTLQPVKLNPTNQNAFVAVKDLVASPHVQGELLVTTQSGYLLQVSGKTQHEIKVPEYIEIPAPKFGGQGQRSVEDVSFIPGFPDALIVGTKEGAVVTRDKGESWIQLPVPAETNETFNSVVVRVSPTNVNRIFVAINSVVYRSEDGGNTWNTFALGLPQHTIVDVSINPTNAAKMLLVTAPIQ